MPTRICDSCGNKKDVYRGKSCEKGHFICSGCNYGKTTCPLCRKPLR